MEVLIVVACFLNRTFYQFNESHIFCALCMSRPEIRFLICSLIRFGLQPRGSTFCSEQEWAR